MNDEQALRVLLADDEQAFATTTAQLLTRRGLPCETAESGEQALERLRDDHFDVLVADIKMPGNDELALLKAVGELVNNPAVVLITGYPSVDTAALSVELGAFAYKIKPFDIEDFVDTVRRAGKYACMRRRISDRTVSTRALLQQLISMRQSLRESRAPDINQTARDYLQLLLVNMADNAMEATALLDCLDRDRADQPVRQLSHDPESEALRNAIEESVKVLERTRNAFKSKELASLRRRLTTLLEITAKSPTIAAGRPDA